VYLNVRQAVFSHLIRYHTWSCDAQICEMCYNLLVKGRTNFKICSYIMEHENNRHTPNWHWKDFTVTTKQRREPWREWWDDKLRSTKTMRQRNNYCLRSTPCCLFSRL